MVTREQAMKLMPPPTGKKVDVVQDYNTDDIITVVLDTYKASKYQAKELAKALEGATVTDTARNVWEFLKYQLTYVLDAPGVQWAKTPARIVSDGFTDCKGYSILANSILDNLGIQAAFKFVSYNESVNPGHVYTIIPTGNNTYITIDACMDGFNVEKQPYNPQSVKVYMSTLSVLSGTNTAQLAERAKTNQVFTPAHKGGNFFKPMHRRPWAIRTNGPTSHADLELGIFKESLLLDRKKIAEIHGIGSLEAEQMDGIFHAVATAHEAILQGDYEEARGIGYALEADMYLPGRSHAEMPAFLKYYQAKVNGAISGLPSEVEERAEIRVGFLKKAAKKIAKKVSNSKAVKFVRKVTPAPIKKLVDKASKVVKKAATLAKKGAKALVKVVSFPLRLLAKGILEVSLPKAAPFFLYLFITNQDTVRNLPAKVARKRRKAEGIANFIINTIGMRREHFMGIVRNGIKKKYGAEPEAVLAKMVAGSISGIEGLCGIGEVGVVLTAAAAQAAPGIITTILDIIKKLSSAFGKKPTEEAGVDDMPNPASDFGGQSEEGEPPMEPERFVRNMVAPQPPQQIPRATFPKQLPRQQQRPAQAPQRPAARPVERPNPYAYSPEGDTLYRPEPLPDEQPTAFEQQFQEQDFPEPEMQSNENFYAAPGNDYSVPESVAFDQPTDYEQPTYEQPASDDWG